MSDKVAFIGLGNMGYSIAGHLATKGYAVTVHDLSVDRVEQWVAEHGGRAAGSPREAAEGAAFVFTCVGADKDLRALAYGDSGLLAGLGGGAIHIDNTTASAAVAEELAAAAAGHGAGFLDAPVSGGTDGAKAGILTVMVGGDAETFARAEPLIRCYGRSVLLMGPVGAGQLTKMVNQIGIAAVAQGLAEGLNFAVSAGLDARRVVEVISKGSAQSWFMDHRTEKMLAGDVKPGFTVTWMRKDLGLCQMEAERMGIELPVTALVDRLYAQIEAMGGSAWDNSSLMARFVAERPKR